MTVTNENKPDVSRIKIHHWSECKISNIKPEIGMLESGGMILSNKSQLLSESPSTVQPYTKYIRYDRNYIKYQIAMLFYRLIFDVVDKESPLQEIDDLKALVNETLDDVVDLTQETTPKFFLRRYKNVVLIPV
jgi:hypothetical protein